MKRSLDPLHGLFFALVPAALTFGCASEGDGAATPNSSGVMSVGDDDGGVSEGIAASSSGSSTGGSADAADAADGAQMDGDEGGDTVGPTSPVKLDLGTLPDSPAFNNCGAPSPVVCDNEDDDPWHALGLNCDGGPQVDGTITGAASALYVHTGNLGTFVPATYPPREGDKMVVLSSGIAQQITQAGLFASTDHPGQDPGGSLPAPIAVNIVSPFDDCATDPTLVGTGDCSNTLFQEWSQGSGANDYIEMRMTVEVPAATFGFSYDLAMFSTEYPDFYQSGFNDMYVAWLESELWTGNVSFDEMGNPISLNAGFLDYKDAPNLIDCPAPCTAPELQGTAMEGHAGTKWLTTTAGVTPGETIELIFAVFDLSDGILDTVVLLDNWQWSCEGGPPLTIPG